MLSGYRVVDWLEFVGAGVFHRGVMFRFFLLFCLSGVVFAGDLLPIPDKLVVLTFDDAAVSHATVVAPLLKKFGFGGTFFVCEFGPDFDDKAKYMSWEQIAGLDAAGLEVASHTRSHKHTSAMAPGEFEQELQWVERRCGELGMGRPRAFAYPAYVHSAEDVRTLRERGYEFARVGDSRAYDPAVDDPLLIPSFSTTGGDERAAQRVFSALRQARDGKIVVLTIHGVPDVAHPQVTTSPELFERYLQFLAEEKYTVVAMRDLARYVKPAATGARTAAERYEARLEGRADAGEWRGYFARSDAWRVKQKQVLDAELAVLQKTVSVPAPHGSDYTVDAAKPPGGSFSSPEAKQLVAAVLSYQLPCGGWSKGIAYGKGPRAPGTHWTALESPWHYAGTFDNRATTGELQLLALAQAVSPTVEVLAGLLRGVDMVLEAQFPNGGWPQNYPLEGGYHDFITLNDSAMLHVLELLELVAEGAQGFDAVDVARRARARAAVVKGNACLLKLQIRWAVWCAQYDALTMRPAHARLFEPASLSGGESVEVVRYLMRQPRTAERDGAIESAIAWFSAAKTFPDTKEGGAARWARFYDLKTQQPIFPGKRDGRHHATFEEMAAGNPVGYDFLVRKPADLIGKWAERWRGGK